MLPSLKDRPQLVLPVLALVGVVLAVAIFFLVQSNRAFLDKSFTNLPEEPKENIKLAQDTIGIVYPEDVEVLYSPKDRNNNQWNLRLKDTEERIDIVVIEKGIDYAQKTYPNSLFESFTLRGIDGWKSVNTSKIIYIIKYPDLEYYVWLTSTIIDDSNQSAVLGSIEKIIEQMNISEMPMAQ